MDRFEQHEIDTFMHPYQLTSEDKALLMQYLPAIRIVRQLTLIEYREQWILGRNEELASAHKSAAGRKRANTWLRAGGLDINN